MKEYIKSKSGKLNRLVNNVVANIEYGEHYREYVKGEISDKVDEAKETYELFYNVNVGESELGKELKVGLLKNINKVAQELRGKLENQGELDSVSQELVNEIKDHYMINDKGELLFVENYFKEREIYLKVIGLAKNIDKNVKEQMEKSNWKGLKEYEKREKSYR